MTESGMVILVKLLQHSNAPSPMLVTESGMVMRVRLLQLQKACSPISFTQSGITTSVTPSSSMYFSRMPSFVI